MLPKRIKTKILVVFFIISAIPLIGFLLLYFQFLDKYKLIDHLIQKQQPTALAWVQLMSGINHSLAAQRGWVLFGTENFKKERQTAWEKEINPMLEQLKILYADRTYEFERAEEVRRFYDIRLALIELGKQQAEIEQIAHTPANEPARRLFEETVQPAFEVMLGNFDRMILVSSSSTTAVQRNVNELKSTLSAANMHLHDFILAGNSDVWKKFQDAWKTIERLLLDAHPLEKDLNPEQLSLLRQALKNHDQVDGLLEELYQNRHQESWNVALYKMVNLSMPLITDIDDSIRTIVIWQSDLSTKTNSLIQEEFDRWRNLLLMVASGVLLLGWVLSRLMSKQVVVPLGKLRDTVRKVKKEDFFGQIEVSTNDEVGELAQEFKEMMQALHERTLEANRSKQILDNSPFPVMLAKPDRELVYLNPAAIRELKQIHQLVLPDQAERLVGKHLDFLLDGSNIPSGQLSSPYTLPTRTDIVLGAQVIEVTFSPLFDAERHYLGPVLHWKNVSQERNNEKARLQLLHEFEEQGISRQKMVDQLEHQNQLLRSQLDLDRAQTLIAKAINSIDIHTILEASLNTIVKTTNSQLGVLYLDDPDNNQLTMTYYYTIDQNVMDDEFYHVQGLPMHIFKTREPKVIRYPSQKQGKSFNLGVVTNYPAVIIGYPLVFQQKCLGVLLLASVSDFSESIIRFLDNTVPTLAVSLHNSLTFQTVQKQQQYLQAANLELAAATRMKSEFLANMSHELRTPLNAIIGFAETLLDSDEENPLTSYQSDRLTRIQKSGQHLLEIINSILDLSKIEAGRMELNLVQFDLKELLDEVMGLMESLVTTKPVKLELIIKTEISQCYTDNEKLRQIFINLLGNSIKFTDHGSVTVIVVQHEDWIKVDIKDTGCGIPEDQIDVVFESFRQVDSSASRKYEGTGLGLALVKSMVQLMGGNVSVVSQLEVGSTFTIYFPVIYSSGDKPKTMQLIH